MSEPWEVPAKWAATLFDADSVGSQLDMTLDAWLGFEMDPERLVWSWHDSYDASLEVCIKGVDADWHMPDARVDEIHSWGFARVWFHYENGTEQHEKGRRAKPNHVRYNMDSQTAQIARLRKERDAAVAGRERMRGALRYCLDVMPGGPTYDYAYDKGKEALGGRGGDA